MGDFNDFLEDRRRYARLPGPRLSVRIGERCFPVVEWSFGGFLVEDDGANLSGGALVKVTGLVLGDPDVEDADLRPVDIRARVVRAQRDAGLAALTSYNLDGAAYQVLSEVRDLMAAEAGG